MSCTRRRDSFTKKEFFYQGKMYFADGEVTFVTDPQFGADADGGRGIARTDIEDVRIYNIYDEQEKHMELEPNLVNAACDGIEL